jgi:hypothetical protein
MVFTLSAAGSKCARISASAAGRATTAVAEQKCREMNVVSIGQTVFGSNKAAQTLYEDLGFKPTVLQMCRRLSRI